MGLIEKRRKEGWFDPPKEIDIDLTEDQIKKIRNMEDVVVDVGNETFLLYLKKGSNLSALEKEDLIIRKISRR